MNIDDISDAYFPINDAGNKVIIPHIAVLMSYNKENKKKTRETSVSLRAEDWTNLADDEKEVFRVPNK